MKTISFQKITFKQFRECIFCNEYSAYGYLGVSWNPYDKGTVEHNIIKDFIIFVDKIARPKYFPKFILRLLNLYGNDNSIVRVRNRFLSDLQSKILSDIMITDIKTKWYYHDIRIYGMFTDIIDDEIDKIEIKFEQLKKDN